MQTEIPVYIVGAQCRPATMVIDEPNKQVIKYSQANLLCMCITTLWMQWGPHLHIAHSLAITIRVMLDSFQLQWIRRRVEWCSILNAMILSNLRNKCLKGKNNIGKFIRFKSLISFQSLKICCLTLTFQKTFCCFSKLLKLIRNGLNYP